MFVIPISPTNNKHTVTNIMNKQHKYPHQPHIHQIREEYQERRQPMMKRILIKIPLRPNKHMIEESSNMLPKLKHIKHLHRKGCLVELTNVSCEVRAVTVSTQPGWHEAGVEQDAVCGEGGDGVEDDGVGPLDESVTALLSRLGCLVTLIAEVIPIAFIFQMAMCQYLQINEQEPDYGTKYH